MNFFTFFAVDRAEVPSPDARPNLPSSDDYHRCPRPRPRIHQKQKKTLPRLPVPTRTKTTHVLPRTPTKTGTILAPPRTPPSTPTRPTTRKLPTPVPIMIRSRTTTTTRQIGSHPSLPFPMEKVRSAPGGTLPRVPKILPNLNHIQPFLQLQKEEEETLKIQS